MQSNSTNPIRSQSQWVQLRDSMRDKEVRAVSGVRVLCANDTLYFKGASGSFEQIAYDGLPANRPAPTLQALRNPYEQNTGLANSALAAQSRRAENRTRNDRRAAYLSIDGQVDPQSLAALEDRGISRDDDPQWAASVVSAARQKAQETYGRQDVSMAEIARFYGSVTDDEIMRYYLA